jgi:hypothetical protein
MTAADVRRIAGWAATALTVAALVSLLFATDRPPTGTTTTTTTARHLECERVAALVVCVDTAGVLTAGPAEDDQHPYHRED